MTPALLPKRNAAVSSTCTQVSKAAMANVNVGENSSTQTLLALFGQGWLMEVSYCAPILKIQRGISNWKWDSFLGNKAKLNTTRINHLCFSSLLSAVSLTATVGSGRVAPQSPRVRSGRGTLTWPAVLPGASKQGRTTSRPNWGRVQICLSWVCPTRQHWQYNIKDVLIQGGIPPQSALHPISYIAHCSFTSCLQNNMEEAW